MDNGPLEISRVELKRGRMCVYVRVADWAPLRTDDEIARRAMEAYPLLGRHTCINSHGATFDAVIRETPLPHLLEHMVIAEQAGASQDADATFVGTTTYINDREAVVEVSFRDDLAAATALGNALRSLERIFCS